MAFTYITTTTLATANLPKGVAVAKTGTGRVKILAFTNSKGKVVKERVVNVDFLTLFNKGVIAIKA